MSEITQMRSFLKERELDYLLINSSNEFLAEYTPLEENSRYALTGFSGSTGDALLSADELYLFVDGRYHAQADKEVDPDVVTVVKLQTGQLFLDELVKKIKRGAVLGVFSAKNSQERVENLKDRGVNVKLLDSTLPERAPQNIVHLDVSLTGLTSEEKKAEINIDGVLALTNPEEVSYILNERDFSHNYSCSVNKKIKIGEGEYFYADKSTISAYDYGLLGDRARDLKDSPVKLMKSVKTEAEIEHYKTAFARTDDTMRAIRSYIYDNDNISEHDIAVRLEREFLKNGAKILSFKPIVAKDRNSALAHYSKNSPDEVIEDGSLVLIDCGAFYEGGLATDITRVFVKGRPSELHKKVYTTVLKPLLHAFNMSGTGFEIDAKAREIMAQNPVEGFVFNHGLGHGIGINVHEYPPALNSTERAKVEITDNMCFTIEPGLYNENYFGVRLENACYFKAGKIHSFTNMNFEQKLINYDMLNVQEKKMLDNFAVK
ncbi:MAG: M24 family metallopeptidase [Heliobacteriaceae bacterium]|jgi:Xaa-Pro aminopeptidase|nr:M24 family metallopeptidase [Heliobacteriaceae bacterium]